MKESSTSVVASLVAKLSRMAICLAFGFLTVVGLSLSAQASSSYERVEGAFLYGYAQEVLKIVNEERSNAGAEQLVMVEELTDVAMMRAAEIAVEFSHDRPNGLWCFSAFPEFCWSVGENIAMGQRSPGAVMGGWMNSTGHRDNILNRGYSKIGIGCFYDGYYYYWVQAFCAAPESSGTVDKRAGEVAVKVDVSLDSSVDTIVSGLPAKKFKVRFLANGGTGEMADQSFVVGKAAKLRKNAFTRSGFVFLGWSKKESGSVQYKNGQSVKDLANSGKIRKLYAVWAKKTYKVKFYSNGGKGTMSVQKLTYGKSVKLSSNKFKKKGYTFKGWAKSKTLANKGKVAYKNKKTVKNLVTNGSTVKLYAVWAKK